MNFDEAFRILLEHEGGYVNDPADPGGETRYGISQRAHPGEDIEHMTLDRAKQIYLRDYWGPAGCDAVPDPVKIPLFDFAVNSGPRVALHSLQQLVGAVPADGIFGPVTLMSIERHPDKRGLAVLLTAERLEHMTRLSNWPAHGRGWARRIAANLRLIVKRGTT